MNPEVIPPDELIHADYWRAVMYAQLADHIKNHPIEGARGIEFGTSNWIIRSMCPGTSWQERNWPEFDICKPWEECDVALADQVLEHVKEPWKAFEHAGAAVRGTCIFTMPFMLKIHSCPGDNWRLTPSCVRELAEAAGFTDIHIDTWGNNRANLWVNQYWHTGVMMANIPEEEWRSALVENDLETPLMIWAVLRK